MVQLYTVPGVGPVKCTNCVADPLQSTWLGTWFAIGVGNTVTVAVIAGPGQPLAVGMIVNVTSCVTAVLLVSVPVIGFAVPLAAMPVTFTKLSLVHA